MKDFVPFEIAKKLKEKGFKTENTDWCYLDGNLVQVKKYVNISPYEYAPTISQVLKWLREEKKISIEVTIHCSLKWMCSIYEFSDGIADFTQYNYDGIDDTTYILYPTYELAVLAGIEYVIDNLI